MEKPVKKMYSRSELEEFRAIVETKLAEARTEFRRLTDSIREYEGLATDNTNYIELGSDTRDKEELEILKERQARFIQSLQQALIRINTGTYGICRITGELIPAERLRIVPHATTTVSAKQKQQTSESNLS
jgi:RNA polymerase-binding transcription factor DksA